MAERNKNATATSKILNAQCISMQAEKQQLSEQVRQTEEQLQKTKEDRAPETRSKNIEDRLQLAKQKSANGWMQRIMPSNSLKESWHNNRSKES